MINKREIKLSARESFHCTGAQCKLSCCKSWTIDIDKPTTLEKWKKITQPELRDRLLNSIHFSELQKAWCLNKDSLSHCVHLEKDLCSIHSELGEEYLPDTCRTYPKFDYSTDKVNVISMEVSCPEVARLIFNGGTDIYERKNIKIQDINVQRGLPEEIFIPVDKMLNETLDTTDYDLNIRLYHIGKSLCDIAVLSQEGKLFAEKLELVCGYNRKGLRNIELAYKYGQLTVDDKDMGRFWNFIYSFIHNLDELVQLDDNQTIIHLRKKLSAVEPSAEDFIEIHKILASINDDLTGMLPKNFDQGLTNILKVKFTNNYFPWAPIQDNLIVPFVHSVLVFALMKLAIRLHFYGKKEFREDECMLIISRVERNLGNRVKMYEMMDKNPYILRLNDYLECLLKI